MQKYLAKVKDLLNKLDVTKVRHVPKEENVRADILSKLANTKLEGNNKSLIQETQKAPSITKKTVLTLVIEEFLSWSTLIIQYFKDKTLLDDPVKAKRKAKEASYYIIIKG